MKYSPLVKAEIEKFELECQTFLEDPSFTLMYRIDIENDCDDLYVDGDLYNIFEYGYSDYNFGSELYDTVAILLENLGVIMEELSRGVYRFYNGVHRFHKM